MANANGVNSGTDTSGSARGGSEERARFEWARKQAREEREFLSHLGTYAAVIAGLFLIDLLTGGDWWFFWPALGWGIAVLIHGIQVYSGGFMGPDREARRTRELMGESRTEPKRTQSPAGARADADKAVAGLIRRGSSAVIGMRADADRIRSEEIRLQALTICGRADDILRVLTEPGRDELLAREFVDQVLGPAESLLTNYTRLSERQIASAVPALRRVETDDLPLLAKTLDDIYQRLHQDDLVSLEVASEMLSLGRSIGIQAGAERGDN